MIELNSKAVGKIKRGLFAALTESTVSYAVPNWEFGAALSQLEQFLPTSGKAHAAIVSTYGDAEDAFSIFIYDRVVRRIRQFNPDSWRDGERRPLATLLGFDDLRSLADELYGAFCGETRSYRLSIILPEGLFDPAMIEDSVIEMAKGGRIAVIDEHFKRQHPIPIALASENRGILAGLFGVFGRVQEWPAGGVAIQFDLTGFVDESGRSQTAHAVVERLRGIFGLGIATYHLEQDGARLIPTFGAPIGLPVVVHQRLSGAYEYDTSYRLDDRVTEGIRSLRLPTASRARLGRGMMAIASQMGSKLLAEDAGARRVRQAAAWFFDGAVGDHPQLNYLQVMVALEILLGHDNEGGGGRDGRSDVGKYTLIRNRCAYLIGRTAADRDDVMKNLREIAEVRHAIVHSGKDRLSNRERVLFLRLRNYCALAIMKEIQAL